LSVVSEETPFYTLLSFFLGRFAGKNGLTSVDFSLGFSTIPAMTQNNDLAGANRNNDLLLQILLELTTPPFPKKISPEQFKGFGDLTPEYFLQHIALLKKHEMLAHDPLEDRRGSVVAQIAWAGHDFLSYAKHNYIWEATKEAVGHLPFVDFIDGLQEANRKAGFMLLTGIIKAKADNDTAFS